MEPKSKNERPASRAIFIVLAIFCVAGIIYLSRGIVYNALYSLKVIPVPERFTELYFTNPAAIPTSTISGKPVSFSFTVVNHEGVTTTYSYVSYFINPSAQKTILASGTVSLSEGAAAIIPVSYALTAAPVTGEIVVVLPSLNNQSIDFLLHGAN